MIVLYSRKSFIFALILAFVIAYFLSLDDPKKPLQISNIACSMPYCVDKKSDEFLHISPIPEPDTYAMMFIGLGLIGVLVKRRNHRAFNQQKVL